MQDLPGDENLGILECGSGIQIPFGEPWRARIRTPAASPSVSDHIGGGYRHTFCAALFPVQRLSWGGLWPGYHPRATEDNALRNIIAKAWPSFLEQVEYEGSLPNFVHREFDSYLKCGQLTRSKRRLCSGRLHKIKEHGGTRKRSCPCWISVFEQKFGVRSQSTIRTRGTRGVPLAVRIRITGLTAHVFCAVPPVERRRNNTGRQ